MPSDDEGRRPSRLRGKEHVAGNTASISGIGTTLGQKNEQETQVVEEPKAGTSRDSSSPALVQQVFGLFKDYLATQLDTQGKKLESKQKIDKETVELKYKGNQKQFRVNAELENILEQIQTANQKGANDQSITDLAKEGKKIIHKRQKLIKIADKCTDGWKVVEEYESDELASDSQDEKKLEKAKEAAGKKRKAKEQKRYDE